MTGPGFAGPDPVGTGQTLSNRQEMGAARRTARLMRLEGTHIRPRVGEPPAGGERWVARLDGWLQRHLFSVILVGIAAGIAAGDGIYRYRALSPYLLAVTMAIATSRSRFGELAQLLRRPSYLLALAVVGYGVAAGAGLSLGAWLLAGAPALRAGFSLLWLGPTATISSLWTHLAGGNVPLAATLTAASVIGSSLWLAPLFLAFNPAYQAAGAIPAAAIRSGLWASTFAFVLLPAIAGMTAAQRFGWAARRVAPFLGLTAKLSVLAIVFINTSGARPHLAGSLGTVGLLAALTVLVELAGHAAAWGWVRWVRPDGPPAAVALAYTGAMRNTALAITLATLYLEPPAALAPVTAFIVQEPLSVLLARRYGRLTGYGLPDGTGGPGGKGQVQQHEDEKPRRRRHQPQRGGPGSHPPVARKALPESPPKGDDAQHPGDQG